MTNFLTKKIEHFEDFLIDVRRDLHRNPELSHQEYDTTERLKKLLTEAGIKILDLPLKTGLVAEISSGTGPRIAIRADIDALPITEETDLAFRSKNDGVMHACGHDFHSAVILGAAYLLKQREEQLQGTVRMIFQPAEETGRGAQEIIDAEGLKGVEAIFGLHNDPLLALGQLGTKPGIFSAGVDRFLIDITGKGAHAARPHLGIDPILVATSIISRLQEVTSREIAATESAVISVSKIHSGSAWNVMPETAQLEGTVRTFSEPVRTLIPEKMEQIITNIAASYGAKAVLDYQAGPPSVENNPEWTAFCEQQAADSGYEVIRLEASAGGEDFSVYQKQIPGAFVRIGIAGDYGLHHPKYTLNEAALKPAAVYFASLAERALQKLTAEAE